MIAERLAELEQRLIAERLRIADVTETLRMARRRCAQLEGAVGVLRELRDAATAAGNGLDREADAG